jgi:hypothetical protein
MAIPVISSINKTIADIFKVNVSVMTELLILVS